MDSELKKSGNESTTIYSPKEVAKMFGVKTSYIKRLLRNGTLKGFRIGKFWRIKKESLDAFIAGFEQDSQGKAGLSQDTIDRIRYHAGLKSRDTTPNSIEKLNENIGRLKAEIQTQDRFGKIPKIAKLKSTVLLREGKRTKMESLPVYLEDLSDKAYPGVKEMVNEAPDALEAKFSQEAQKSEDSQKNTEEEDSDEDGFSVDIVTTEGPAESQMERASPDEKPWRVMKEDDPS